MHKKVFGKAALCLSALFVLGDAIIILPSKNGAYYTFYSFLLASVLSFAVYFVASCICNKLITEKNNCLLGKTAEIFILISACVFSLIIASNTFLVFLDFTSEIILKTISFPIIIIVFSATVLYFALKRQECILKFSLVFFVAVLGFIIFFFIAPMGNYEYDNLAFKADFDWKIFLKSLKSFTKNPILSCLILPFYYRFALKERHISAHLGVILGYFLLLIGILSPLLLFGSELSAELSFPHFSAVSTITVGRLYTRLDGFLYLIYFITAITKINVCIFVITSCLKKLGEKCIIKTNS